MAQRRRVKDCARLAIGAIWAKYVHLGTCGEILVKPKHYIHTIVSGPTQRPSVDNGSMCALCTVMQLVAEAGAGVLICSNCAILSANFAASPLFSTNMFLGGSVTVRDRLFAVFKTVSRTARLNGRRSETKMGNQRISGNMVFQLVTEPKIFDELWPLHTVCLITSIQSIHSRHS